MEYFIVANSFAAPFFSDRSTSFQKANNPEQSLKTFAKKYDHPCGLYAAVCYKNAEDYHKNKKPLAKWLSNDAKFMEGKTGMIKKEQVGEVEINGVMHHIENPQEGSIVLTTE